MVLISMIVLGLDAGFSAPGFAIVDLQNNGFGKIIHTECFMPKLNKEENKLKKCKKLHKADEFFIKINQVCDKIHELITTYNVELVITELPVGGAKSAKAIRGMAFSFALTISAIRIIQKYYNNLKVEIISPQENKRGSLGVKKLTRNIDISKWSIFNAVDEIWKEQIDWPKLKRKDALASIKCWAVADALSCVATYARAFLN